MQDKTHPMQRTFIHVFISFDSIPRLPTTVSFRIGPMSVLSSHFLSLLSQKSLNLLGSSLLSMLLKRMLRVRAQAILGLVARLLSALLGSRALLVDVVARLARLRTGLALGLGGLAAGVGGRHGCGCVCVGVVCGLRTVTEVLVWKRLCARGWLG
jgi:hypothetical protein